MPMSIPALDGVVKKGGMHRFANRVVAAEGKRNIAHAAADLAEREGFFNRDVASRKLTA